MPADDTATPPPPANNAPPAPTAAVSAARDTAARPTNATRSPIPDDPTARRTPADHDATPPRTLAGVTGQFAADDASAPAHVAFAEISEAPISVEWCVDNVESDEYGAVVTFSGIVRNHDHGKGVLRLSYSGHPTVPEVMRQVADDIAQAHPGTRIAVAHRLGELGVGDIALAAAVASAHRAQAFAACAELVDTVKARVPIWKEQWFTDGTTEWVGAG